MRNDVNLAHQKIEAAKVYLRVRSPFWSTLLLFARMEVGPSPTPPRLDGKTISFTGEELFWARMTPPEVAALLCFVLFQLALGHPALRGVACSSGLEVAYEIAINGFLAQHSSLPPGAVRRLSLEGRPVCEVYRALYGADPPHTPPPELSEYWRRALGLSARAQHASRAWDKALCAALSAVGISFHANEVSARWSVPGDVMLCADDIWAGEKVEALPEEDRLLTYEVVYTLGAWCVSVDAAIAALRWVFQRAPSFVFVLGKPLMESMRAMGLQGVLALRVQKTPDLRSAIAAHNQKYLGVGGTR